MAIIELTTPDGGPYKGKINIEALQVTIKHAYLGVKFISPSGTELSVCMRDDGFELITDKDQKLTFTKGKSMKTYRNIEVVTERGWRLYILGPPASGKSIEARRQAAEGDRLS